MDVVSLCAFRVASVLWQQRPGSWIKTVVCKATFDLVPGEARMAAFQEEPNDHDNYWDDDAARSLYSPSDIVPFKTRCDVLLVGHAFAPQGEPVRSLVARMRVGEINKAIEIFGERLWTRDKGIREGARFAKMPLRYERASGGPVSWNPVGVRTGIRPDASTLIPIPNLQAPGTRLTDPAIFMEPIGFGPIAPSWPPRRHRLGQYAGTFTYESIRRDPLPPDMDPGFWNSAPRDQQPGTIRSNERLSLENLHPEHARLATALPGLYPRAFVDKGGGVAQQELPLTCDTLWIDTDRAICTLTWRACLPVDGPAQGGRILVGMEGPGQRLAWADIERLAASAPPPAPAAQGPRPPGAQGAIQIADPVTVDGVPDDDDGRETQLPPSPRRAARLPAAPPDAGDETLATLAFPVNFAKLASEQGHALKRGPMDTVLEPNLQEGEGPRDTVPPQAAAPPLVGPAMPFVRTPGGAPGAPAPSGMSAAAKAPLAPPAAGAPPAAPGPDREVPRIRFGPPPPPPPSAQGDAAPAWLAQPRVSPPVAPPPPPIGAGNPHSAAIPLTSAGAPSGAGTPIPPSPISAPPVTPRPGASIPPSLAAKSIEFGPPPKPVLPMPSPGPGPSMAAPQASPVASISPSPPIAPAPAAAGEGIAHPAVATAAFAGALAASNAAAATTRVEPAPAASPVPLPRPFVSSAAREACHLLWYEKESVSAVRGAPDWKLLLESLDGEKEPAFFDFDEEPPPEPPPEVQERRAIVAVLTRASPTDTESLGLLLIESVGDDGSFTPPLVLMAGELFFPFDEVETLKATVTAVTPLISPDRDKKLKETVDTANELLKTPWIHSSSGIAESMTQKVREAFGQSPRVLPAGYLDTHTQRILLEQRHYQKRSVFGEEAIRSELVPSGSQMPIPTYLPSALAKKLPMFQRLKVKVIAEAHVQQDQFESHPSALRVVALGRAVTLGGRPR